MVYFKFTYAFSNMYGIDKLFTGVKRHIFPLHAHGHADMHIAHVEFCSTHTDAQMRGDLMHIYNL